MGNGSDRDNPVRIDLTYSLSNYMDLSDKQGAH
jgi:hypothetical protein